jgi:hypothetical protein
VGSVAAVANLVPLVGVLTLGWNVYSLLVLYWMEGLVTVLLAAAKALFAERGSRGFPISSRSTSFARSVAAGVPSPGSLQSIHGTARSRRRYSGSGPSPSSRRASSTG